MLNASEEANRTAAILLGHLAKVLNEKEFQCSTRTCMGYYANQILENTRQGSVFWERTYSNLVFYDTQGEVSATVKLMISPEDEDSVRILVFLSESGTLHFGARDGISCQASELAKLIFESTMSTKKS